jgi:hypothetical protein
MSLEQKDTKLDLQRPHPRSDIGLHCVQLSRCSTHAAVPRNCFKDLQIGGIHDLSYLQK